MGEFEGRRGQGEDRDLDHFVPLGEVVDPAEGVGVHQILGVVGEDHVEADIVFALVEEHALVDPVETVGLGGGAVMGADGEMDVGEALLGLADGGDGGGVVGIGADEELETMVVELGDVVFDHLLDDLVLLPECNEDGHEAGLGRVEVGFGGNAVVGMGGEMLPEVREGCCHVNDEVVESVEQDPEGQGDEQRRHPVIEVHPASR